MTSHYREIAEILGTGGGSHEIDESYVVGSGPSLSLPVERNPAPIPAGTNSLPAEVGEPLPDGYDELFDPPLKPDYECPICMNCLRDPVQTACGHRFCKDCIETHMRVNGHTCPCDNQQVGQVFPDNFAKREINLFPVKCRTVRENKNCPWKGELQKLPIHLEVCEFVEVVCPNACGVSIQRNLVDGHTKKECAKRKVVCQHCKTDLLHKNLKDHLERCQKVQISCQSCGKKLLREKLPNHTQMECPKGQATCEFREHGCKWTGIRSSVAAHLQGETQRHMSLLQTAVSKLSVDREQNKNKASTSSKSDGVQQTSKVIDTLARHAAANEQTITKLKEQLEQLERKSVEQISRFERRFDELGTEAASFKSNMVEMEARMCNGVYLWRIINYSKHVDDAKRGQVTAVHSPPFYTEFYGYKLCLRVNPNGVDTGFGSHISLFVHMMQSEWDDILEWPFSGRITLSILDQSGDDEHKRHISETLVTRPSLLAFQRPTSPRNHKGYGYVEFAYLDTLQTRLYIKNDCLLVRVTVTNK